MEDGHRNCRFPKAELKLFWMLAGSARERRWKEHQEKAKMTLAEVFDEVIERDRRDRERKVSPLVRAIDACYDNTQWDRRDARDVMLAENAKRNWQKWGGNRDRGLIMRAFSAGSAGFVSPLAVALTSSGR